MYEIGWSAGVLSPHFIGLILIYRMNFSSSDEVLFTGWTLFHWMNLFFADLMDEFPSD